MHQYTPATILRGAVHFPAHSLLNLCSVPLRLVRYPGPNTGGLHGCDACSRSRRSSPETFVSTTWQLRLARKAAFGKSLFDTVVTTQIEAWMYRIIKRIVHTVTTVTWLVRWENGSSEKNATEQEITFPPSLSVTEEELSETNPATQPRQSTENDQPILDQGEKS
jgi:hypothetical protein